jgi:hypothetical protein
MVYLNLKQVKNLCHIIHPSINLINKITHKNQHNANKVMISILNV